MGSHEIGTTVTVDIRAPAPLADEAVQTSNEERGRQIGNEFDVDCGSDQADEYTYIGFGYFDLTYHGCFHVKRARKIHADLTEWLYLI